MMIQPEIGLRLRQRAVCQDAALQDTDRSGILREFVKVFIRNFIYEKALDWVKHSTYQGFNTGSIELDVHVLTPVEYNKLMEECYAQGLRDAQRFLSPI